MATEDESINNENTFSMLRGKIQDAILDSLESMGLIHPTRVQIRTFPDLLYGKDLLVLSEPGSGNTLAYLIPVLEMMMRMQFQPRDGLGCIIVATRDRLDKISNTLQRMLKFLPLTAAVIRKTDEISLTKQILARGVNILIGTPDELYQLVKGAGAKTYSVANVKMLIIARLLYSSQCRVHMATVASKIPKNRQIIIFHKGKNKGLKEFIKTLGIDLVTINLIKKNILSHLHPIDSTKEAKSMQQIYTMNHDFGPKCDINLASDKLPMQQNTNATPDSDSVRCNINYNSNELLPYQHSVKNHIILDTIRDSNEEISQNEAAANISYTFWNEKHSNAENQLYECDDDKTRDMLFIAYNQHLIKFLQIGVDYSFACTLAHMQVSKLLRYEWHSLNPEVIAEILEIDPLYHTTDTYEKMLAREREVKDELKMYKDLFKLYKFHSIVCNVVNKTRMNEKQIKLVQDVIIQQILMIPPKRQAPRFNSFRCNIESLIFNCADLRTLDWLTNVVAGLELWPDCELSIIEKFPRPKCNIVMVPIPGIPRLSIVKILKSFEIQNYGLIVKYWRCIGWSNGKYSQNLTFIIDDYSFCVLQLMRLTLFFGLKKVQVNMLAMSENVKIFLEQKNPNAYKKSGMVIDDEMIKAIRKEKLHLANDISELILDYKRNQTKSELVC